MSESVIGIGKAKVEVRTGKYRTAFAPRDNQSAANQIAMLQSMLVERDARLAAAEAEGDGLQVEQDLLDSKMQMLGERLAAAERERDEAREWIAKHYRQWPANSPTAVDLRTELPWLGAFSEKGEGEG